VLLVAAMAALSGSLVPVAALGALAAVASAAWWVGRRVPLHSSGLALAGATAAVVAAAAVLVGFGSPGWQRMGGLLLTLWLALAGILLSFPAGVLLALGRRSALPAVRFVCAGYIELIRGVPLVALLFIGHLVIGFFLPPGGSRPSDVTRALISIVLFTAAYVAEIVRGGLQSVPRGQLEAAAALGLRPVTATRLIVLPQALRAVIPPLVGQFITLFKDTSLVAAIGLVDLLGVASALTSQPQFLAQGLQAETLGFASFVYWVGAYSMSRASRRLEARLGVGTR
jgi:general L-amino acid transport system permease protein